MGIIECEPGGRDGRTSDVLDAVWEKDGERVHDTDAFRAPILIETPEGLGMEMPESTFSPRDVADVLGGDTPVEVIGESNISTHLLVVNDSN